MPKQQLWLDLLRPCAACSPHVYTELLVPPGVYTLRVVLQVARQWRTAYTFCHPVND